MELKKAVRTIYGGVEYDSGLEAKYAEAFDALGIRFDVKPKRFNGNGFQYRPDFYLPDLGTYFEVKGLEWRREIEQAKANLVLENGCKLYLGDNNGYLYEVRKDELVKAKPIKCLSCGRWYLSPWWDFLPAFISPTRADERDAYYECRYGCKDARYDIRDNIFEPVGLKIYEYKRRYPIGEVRHAFQ